MVTDLAQQLEIIHQLLTTLDYQRKQQDKFAIDYFLADDGLSLVSEKLGGIAEQLVITASNLSMEESRPEA